MATLLNKFKQKREAENSLPSFDNGGVTWDKMKVPERRDYIINFLKKKGLGDIQVYAILGNLEQENSSFDTKLTNSIGATGIAQWYNIRAKQLRKRKNSQHIDTQLEHLWDEIQGEGNHWTKHMGGKDAFFKAKDLPTAVKIFRKDFERPGEHEAHDSKRLNYAVKASKGKINLPEDFKISDNEEYNPSYENTVFNQYENMAKAYSILAGTQVSAEDIERRMKAENGLAGIQAELMVMEKAKEHQKEVAEANKLAEEALKKEEQEKVNKKAQEEQAIITAMEQQQKEREFHANAYLGTMKQDVKIDPAVFSSGGGEQQPFRFNTQFNLQNAQLGGVIKEQKDFLQSYVDSPMYKKRLESQFSTPEKIEIIQKERSERLKKAKINFTEKPIGKNFGYILGQYVQEKAHPNQIEANIYSPVQGKFTNDIIEKGEYATSQDGSKKWKKGEIYLEPQFNPKNGEPLREYATIPIHEMGHLLDSGAKDMPLKFIASVANRVNGVKRLGEDMFVETAFDGVNWTSDNKPVGFEYTATPSEISARLQSTRYMLNKNNIYDARKDIFTEEHLDKMLMDPTINELQDVKDLYKEMKGSSPSDSDIDKMKNDKDARKNFIWFMNNIAHNNQNIKKNYAQKGGVIQQAFEKPNLLKFKNKYNLK